MRLTLLYTQNSLAAQNASTRVLPVNKILLCHVLRKVFRFKKPCPEDPDCFGIYLPSFGKSLHSFFLAPPVTVKITTTFVSSLQYTRKFIPSTQLGPNIRGVTLLFAMSSTSGKPWVPWRFDLCASVYSWRPLFLFIKMTFGSPPFDPTSKPPLPPSSANFGELIHLCIVASKSA